MYLCLFVFAAISESSLVLIAQGRESAPSLPLQELILLTQTDTKKQTQKTDTKNRHKKQTQKTDQKNRHKKQTKKTDPKADPTKTKISLNMIQSCGRILSQRAGQPY